MAKHLPDSALSTPLFKFKAFKKAIATPITLSLIGLYSTTDNDLINKFTIYEERNEKLPKFHHNADNYLQFAPILAVYGLNLAGIKGDHNFRDRTMLLLKTELVVCVLTRSLKKITDVPRPDTGAKNSFPSGHTAQAFAAATFMHKEYGEQSIWYSIGAYSTATTVGVMRVLNNRHWVSDVLVGAGIGILSANIVYLTHGYHTSKRRDRKDKEKKMVILPTMGSSTGFYFAYKF